jgi:hypothetical protein
VERLLTRSAWAKTQAGLAPVARLNPSGAAVDSAVTIRLHSAIPLRQALARLRQLNTAYDQKSDRDKAVIDAKNKPLLECTECGVYYMVTVRPAPGSANALSSNLPLYTRSLGWLKLHVEIKNEKGEARELVRFVDPSFNGEEAMFFFLRNNSKGEPLIRPANRTLTISFDPHVFGWTTWAVTKFEFDVAKMTVDGKVVF